MTPEFSIDSFLLGVVATCVVVFVWAAIWNYWYLRRWPHGRD